MCVCGMPLGLCYVQCTRARPRSRLGRRQEAPTRREAAQGVCGAAGGRRGDEEDLRGVPGARRARVCLHKATGLGRPPGLLVRLV